MEKSNKKATKQDIMFVLVLAFWAIASMSRFYDEKLNTHAASFEILQSESFSMLSVILYVVMQLVFCLICCRMCEKKKNVYYLAAFLSVFTFPMFWSSSYFGTMDVYAWIMTFLCGVLLVVGKAQWLVVPLSFLMTMLCPMAVFSCECMVVALLIYKGSWKKQGKYIVLVILNILAALAGVFIAYKFGNLQTDAQDEVELSKFIIMIICMSPYIFIAAAFFFGLIKKVTLNKKLGAVVMVLAVLPSGVVHIYTEDYARAIFYVFTYFIFVVLSLVAMQDDDVEQQLEATKDKIKEYLPIPVLIIAYPLLFMSLWIAGAYVPLKETFISK